MNRLIIGLIGCLAMVGCTQNTSKLNAEQIQNIDNAQEQINHLNEHAEQDSTFRETPEYALEMERKHIAIAKSMRGLTENEKLLQRYELALKDLNTYSIRLKSNAELSKNSFFMETFQNHGNTARELYQTLSKTQLTSEERDRFNELTSYK